MDRDIKVEVFAFTSMTDGVRLDMSRRLRRQMFSDTHEVTLPWCFLQMFCIYTCSCVELCSLTAMAYDRYVCICYPLHYNVVMNNKRVGKIILLVWIYSFTSYMFSFSFIIPLTFCGNVIDKVFCDQQTWSLVKLACGSTRTNDIFGLIVIAFYCVHFLFIVCSYVQLVKSALKSTKGKRKFTRTCVPHLLCLLNVSVALLFDVMYSRYGSASVPQSVKNFFAIQFIVIPPILNPIIYGLILTKIRNRIIYLCGMAGQRFQLRVKV
uniref:olfactory receptor 52J3-like n=1 Tax=Gasterosteus aculeatus aculeatus TaxID=481459 RepID=UPI001A99935A|nr:olfactory receptor 52J3-like [Gasterosteus aculeatus aculeatus]